MTDDETYQVMNEINQRFVDLFGDSGKEWGLSLDPGYNTDIARAIDERFRMPFGQIALLSSLHPELLAQRCERLRNGRSPDSKRTAGQMSKFTEGYGVVFGECGVLPKSDGSLKSNTWTF